MQKQLPGTIVALAKAYWGGADCLFALHDALEENGLLWCARHYTTGHGDHKCHLTEFLAGKMSRKDFSVNIYAAEWQDLAEFFD